MVLPPSFTSLGNYGMHFSAPHRLRLGIDLPRWVNTRSRIAISADVGPSTFWKFPATQHWPGCLLCSEYWQEQYERLSRGKPTTSAPCEEKKVFSTAALLAVGFSMEGAQSFQAQSSSLRTSTSLYGYVPSGFTPEQYKKFKEEEAKKKQQKNLGRMGPKGFQSRSFQSFQEALERGEAAHLMPVFNAKEKVRKGAIKPEDIPYMQRGGAWDNSDIRGAKKAKWLSSDKDYASGGFKKEQSVSIFGIGEGLDWTGSRSRGGPSESIPGAAPKFAKNYKAPNVSDLKGASKPKKKLFGLF
eukprot:scaffold4070_cov104-Cylindrotheca_fusiformis.AAC.3